jgi:hypothetical protein
MEKRETRGKQESTGCCGFGNANMDSGKMAEMASSCCDGRKGSPNRSGMGKKMMRTMMEMCCGPKAEKKEQCSENDNA